MESKLLFVDDDRSLLNGIKRLLSFDYRLDTAESGQEGLDAIRQKGPYSVIFTDMRMPHMDGLQFVERARPIASDAVFVMLTGNNDQETAVHAINQGRVFRFLRKPCEERELLDVIADCTRQFQLVLGEKELLHQTFVGSVRVLTDVIDAIQPELAGRGERVQENIAELCRCSGIDERWEFKLAGRLSTLGLALLPEADRLRMERRDHDSAIAIETRRRTASIVGRLLRDIPRLEDVAAICEQRELATGKIRTLHPETSAQIVAVGAVLLQAASLWEDLKRRGLSSSDICQEIRRSLPELPSAMTKAIATSSVGKLRLETVVVEVEALEEGMVAGADILTSEGGVLLRRGRRLTQVTVEKLQGYGDLRPIEITSASAGFQPPAVAAT